MALVVIAMNVHETKQVIVPTERDKGDTVLVVHFFRGMASVDTWQGGALHL